METNIYQSIDPVNNNPLDTQKEVTKKISLKSLLTQDPKMLVLFILASIIALLLIATLIVSIIRNTSSNNSSIKTVPTPIPSVSPTPMQTEIDPKVQERFNQIQDELKKTENFLPPEIDTDTGV